jgi:hypothetical protein
MAEALNSRVLELAYERPDKHWWMVSAYGWAFDNPEDNADSSCHNSSFPTKREAMAARKWLVPCKCLRCTSRGVDA